MSSFEPKPLSAEQHEYYAVALERRADWVDENVLYAAVLWLEQREAHVIEVLRDAQKCGGGYGFVRDILRYLGADQEGQG